MRLYRSLLLLCPVLMVAACSGGADSAAPVVSEDATEVSVSDADESSGIESDPTVEGIDKKGVIAMSGAMAAMIEFCELPGAGDRNQALDTLRADASKHGMSAGEVERYFTGAYDAAMQKAKADPAKAQNDCAKLAKMTDPAEVKRMEESAKKMEAMVKKMEADMKRSGG